ncbi:putative fibrinogen-like protein 1 [Apostichopus japonicus]|uniref:Putative fibrinogen-like protein 1 n=1 Tax=Stichopus japonicus TaxID=307972 RepID=A0A2G8JT59_STIJA|nr:putative fibrinogen-like protein 1 [Apostichopus japonicus]
MLQVIQRRDSGAVNFDRSWSQYKDGFGFLSTEFWLGNEKLSYLTNQGHYELRVDIKLSNGASFYTTYRGFRITDEWGQYQVTHIGELESNANRCQEKKSYYTLLIRPSLAWVT